MPNLQPFQNSNLLGYLVAIVSLLCGILQNSLHGDDQDKRVAPTKQPVKLPGLIVDLEKNCLDLDATVCLDKGLLELIACRKGTKEHESIVATDARPMHIHTGLLLLGLKNGNPATRKQLGQDKKRWVDLAPKGDKVKISLLIQKNGKWQERPISDFVVHVQDKSAVETQTVKNRDRSAVQKAKDKKPFPSSFLFTGSELVQTPGGTRQYLADKSGHVVSIVSFGDDLVALPEVNSHDNGSLQWRIKPNQLPAPKTKVKLRIRPATPASPKKKNSE